MNNFGDLPDAPVAALIGDLLGSRSIDRRTEAQDALERELEALDQRLGDGLAARFVLTLGDEFQGLLRAPELVLPCLIHLETHLPALPIRFGVGWGRLATQLRARAIGMDGPCFHHARAALERAKREQRWIVVAGFGADLDATLNAVLRLLGELRMRWTDTQAETVALMRRLGTQKAVAAARGVAPSTISEALSAALFDPTAEVERALAGLLRSAPEGPGSTAR